MRRAAKRDLSEAAVVKALEAAGALVYRLDRPCDLLVRYRGLTHLMECKTPGPNLKRKDQKAQRDFCALWEVPIIKTPVEALVAVGAIAAQHN